ncbi:MAG: M23 family peptidase [Clostridium butyricum]|nr:M23 family peptidase [Clostridium butyricum]
MDKKLKDKFKNMFRKEGFYISLFLCLCVIVAAGAFSYKQFSKQSEVNKAEDVNQDVSYNSSNDAKSATSGMQNAERVENTTSSNDNEKKLKENNSQKSTVVSNTATVKFIKPLDGSESRNYTYPTPVKMGENSYRTIKGININAPVGTEVKAAADGVVEVVDNSGVEEGIVIQIKHANGMKTRYGNLDPNVSVKQGDKVTSNQVIGKVGETAKVFSKDMFGEFLNLQVINSKGEQVNPEKYFNLNK